MSILKNSLLPMSIMTGLLMMMHVASENASAIPTRYMGGLAFKVMRSSNTIKPILKFITTCDDGGYEAVSVNFGDTNKNSFTQILYPLDPFIGSNQQCDTSTVINDGMGQTTLPMHIHSQAGQTRDVFSSLSANPSNMTVTYIGNGLEAITHYDSGINTAYVTLQKNQ